MSMVADVATEAGSLLHAPSDEAYEQIERSLSSYKPFHTFELEKEKQYQQQYADMYFLRLTQLKPKVMEIAHEAWDGFQIAGEEVRRVERVLDVRQGKLCWVAGTVYMEMPLKPNILEDISKDHWISAPPPRQKYISPTGEDQTMLEDESGRLRLVGPSLANEMLVTGCVVAVMGTENANGDFEVIDIRVPDLPPQPARWATSKPPELTVDSGKGSEKIKLEDEDETIKPTMPASNSKLAIISGLGISGTSTEQSLQINLLLEYLTGEALDPVRQKEASRINRLIIAGNSLAPENNAAAHDTVARKAHKKYGYDSSAYNPAPTAHLDDFLATLLPSMPITLIPGASDPANVSLPQQPIHSALFPHSRAYAASPPSVTGEGKQVGWFDAVTNPWDGEIDGWRVLGTGGQNIDDIFKYVEDEDRLSMLEAMCRWRCVAPTAPDTLWSYPFQDVDPFVLHECPHIFFAGSQPKFDTALIKGQDGQMVRLITVPRFAETGEIVLVDMETLEVERVTIAVL